MDELNQVCDSSHEGNGRPGAGIIFPAVEKLLYAVSALMDICDDTGADRRGALALVTRRENELIKAAAKHDAKVASLRAEVAAHDKTIGQWQDFLCRVSDMLWGGELAWDCDGGLKKMGDELKRRLSEVERLKAPLTEEEAQAAWDACVPSCRACEIPGIDAAIREVRKEKKDAGSL